MSLRSVGNQLLQTASSSLPAGASTASLSLWVRVNPGSNVANINGVEIFGDVGGKISATLSGSGSLQIRWLSHNGSINSSSIYGMTLTPGTSYHIATVWQNASQQYYLNGVQVHADTQPGAIGIAGDTTVHPYRLGSDSAGTDVIIDEPTLWVGYALSAQDVLNLRDRIVQSSAIASSSIVLEWSLAGPDGVTAQIGDAGLTDGSATGLNLSSIVGVAPTYQGGVLSYVPPVTIGTASVGASGESINLLFQDSSGNPTNVSALTSNNDSWQITLTGKPAGLVVPLTFGGQTTANIPVTTNDPAVYALATLTGLTAGVVYDLAFTWGIGNGGYTTSGLAEVFDGAVDTSLLATKTFNETINGSSFTDQTTGNGTALPWLTIGTFTPSGTTLTLRISSTAGITQVDACRLYNHSTTAVTYYDDLNAVWTYAGASLTGPDGNRYLGAAHFFFGSGAGPVYRMDPAVIQSDFQALSSVGAGNATVTAADSLHNGPYTLTFINAMRGVAQGPITTTATNTTIAHTNVGGLVATYSRNGGASVGILDWLYGKSSAYQPFMFAPLPQSAPALQYAASQTGLTTVSGSYGYGVGGYSGQYARSGGPSFLMTFSFPQLSPGSYQFYATWVPNALNATNAPFLVEDGSATVLSTTSVNQVIAPSGVTDQGVVWSVVGSAVTVTYPNTVLNVVLNATTANGIVIGDGIRLVRLGSDTSVSFAPTDVVTLTIPAGLITTTAGAIPAQTITLTNNSGGTNLPAFSATPAKTMKAGYNFELINNLALAYTNIAKLIGQPMPGVVTFDANGYPTVLAGASANQIGVAGHGQDVGGSYLGLVNLPNGLYTFRWDGTCDVQGDQLGNYNMTEQTTYRILTGSTGKQRVYNFQGRPGYQLSPDIFMNVYGTTAVGDGSGHYHCDLQNLRIYPPNPSDPTGMTPWGTGSQVPPKWHPSLLTKLPTNGTLRFMDNFGTNNPGWADYTDLQQASALSYVSIPRTLTITGATITGYTGPDTFWDITAMPVYLVTTPTPHGIKDRLYVTVNSQTTSVMSGGPGRPTPGGGSCCHVLSPTTFTMHWFEYQFAGQHMTNTLTDGVVQVGYTNFLPFTEMVDLCNTTGNDFWLNISMAATDACVTSIGNYVATHLNSGLQCRAEWGNECWNPGFQTHDLAMALTHSIGGSYTSYAQGFTYYTAHCHTLLKACFTTAGRPNDLIRVFGSFYGFVSNSTTQIAAYAAANGIPIDVIALAPYFRNCSVYFGDEPSLYQITKVMTTGQDLDLFEQNIQYGGIQQTIAGHTAALVAAGFTTTTLSCYEGGIDFASPYQDPTNFDRRNHAIVRNTRFYHLYLYHMQNLQNLGITAFNDFFFSQGAYIAAGLGEYQWSAFIGWNQALGTGDPTIDTINNVNPGDVVNVKSEVGGAIRRWAMLTTGSSRGRTGSNSGRNGQLRATGYSRGLLRPTR